VRLLAAVLLLLGGSADAAAQAARIHGRVTRAVDGRPLPAARIELRRAPPDTAAIALALADGDGRFVIPVDGEGPFVVAVSLIGYTPWQRTGVMVSGEPTANVDVVLEPVSPLLNQIVISASRRQEPASAAPAAVSVIDEATLTEQPGVTAVDHVREAPGVDAAMTGIIQHHIVTRGFNGVFSGALLVLTDYRYGSVPSLRVNTPWLLPKASVDLDRIEIVLGPAAALYGPNATAGVLHIFSKSPFDDPGTSLGMAGLWRSGNPAGPAGGGYQVSARHAGTVGQSFGYKATAQYLAGTDWQERDSVEEATRRRLLSSGLDPAAVRVGRRDHDVARLSSEVEAAWRPSERAEMTIAAGTVRAGSAIELTGVGAAQVQDWRYSYVQARGRRDRLFGQAFVNLNHAGHTFLLRSGDSVVDRSRMYVAQLQHSSDVGGRQTLTYGLDAQHTEPRTAGTINGRNEDDDDITEVGGYLQSETRLTPRVDLVAALRLDRNSRLSSAVVSPRAAVVFRQGDSRVFRVTVNRAFETPTAQNLFADIAVTTPLPFVVRSIGVPKQGYSFRRDCSGPTGLCMRSPYATESAAALPLDATLLWPRLVDLARQAGIGDLRDIPAPTAQDVGSVLRRVDMNAASPHFDPSAPGDVLDVAPLRPMVTNAVEAGFKGEIADRLTLAFSAYYESREDFIAPPQVITPTVFLDPVTLRAYLGRFFPEAEARRLATTIGGIVGSTDTLGIPLGTVAPEGELGGSPDVLVAPRNVGRLHRVGSDAGAQLRMSDVLSLTAAWSWTNKVLWTATDIGGTSDLALNAPADRFSFTVQYRDRTRGLSAHSRVRYAGGFPMNSGVYVGRVESSTLADGGVAYRLPRRPDALLTLTARNLFNTQHREFLGAPSIGRFVLLQLEYTIR
jgi:iron complex outermembrane receptor protein